MNSWLLLLHHIPPKPAYFRAKILRRLTQVGALALKNSAYLLPDADETREDFEWICREITGQGGAAWLFRTDILVGQSTDKIQAQFRALRDADYDALLAAAPDLDLARLQQRLTDLTRIDFFCHPSRTKVEELISRRKSGADPTAPAAEGRTWVTRRGIKVDRIASAWLIRGFIDPAAHLRFVDLAAYTHSPGELRFDMFGGEFTHESDMCTFETLLARHGLTSPALHAIGEIVHDIDLKENRYQRPETSGIARLIDGLVARLSDDEARLAEGSQLFDSLHRSFSA